MKYTKALIAIACAGALSTACDSLDQEPMSNIVTEIQKEEIVANDPAMVAASVNTLPDMVKAYMNTFGTHQDYGWPSMMLMLDSRGQDMPSNLGGYQWYTAALEYSDFGGRYYDNLYYWYTNYNLIRSCNAVAAVINPETEDAESMYYLAQALSFRAWAYFNLTQMYAWSYSKNPQDLSVPLVLDTNMNETATNGCARATVAEVYDQIYSDLDKAITCLTKANEQGVNRANMSDSGSLVKTYFNLTAAYALRARFDLFHTDYDQCVKDCETALRLAEAEGLSPYTRDQLASPRFIDINDQSWILGIYYDPSAAAGRSIASFASFMSAWNSGYASEGFYRRINESLYAKIGGADIRKGWWLDESAKAPATLPSTYATSIAGAKIPYEPYSQIKFGAYSDDPSVASFATDIPLIRIEEVYLMLAEAQAKSAPATGAATLVNFLKEYRDPNYAFTGTTFEAVQEEVWTQRRIELWGEGFSFWDVMRLQKPIDRRGGGYDPTLVFNIDPNNTVLLFDIPQSEAQRNPLIVNASRGSEIPQPIEDKL